MNTTFETETQGTAVAVQQPQAIPTGVLPQRKRGFTGTQLKILAIVAMAIDHFGAIAMVPIMTAMPQSVTAVIVMLLMRCIGRLAFPTFCFLIVEGFLHTHDVKKYIFRLAIFAFVSEIPFDIAIYGNWFQVSHQNVFFTLVLGLLAIWGIDALRGKSALQIGAAALCVIAAQLLKTDYAGMGVVTIILFYVLREHKKVMFWAVGTWLFLGMVITYFPDALAMLQGYPMYVILIGAASNGLMELVGAFSFLFLSRYNGERGAKLPKYLFYVFYPAHLLIIYGIAMVLSGILLG